jgi:hypothetical protein
MDYGSFFFLFFFIEYFDSPLMPRVIVALKQLKMKQSINTIKKQTNIIAKDYWAKEEKKKILLKLKMIF